MLTDLTPGSHVCWIVSDEAAYVDLASTVLRLAEGSGEKPVVFGPEGSPARALLAPLAAQAADPHTAFLGRGALDPDAMFRVFEEQTALARSEGYRGLRLVADMDWLLPARPATEEMIAFELLLDRRVNELGATIVCAYRESSFDTTALKGAACVHPVVVGAEAPAFRFVAEGTASWSLVGEVDASVAGNFETALTAAARLVPCVVDASGLEFIDVAGMRTLAQAGLSSRRAIRVVHASPFLRRCWEIGGFGELGTHVELVA